MAYDIKKYDGTTLTSVPDASVVSTECSLRLIGRNYASYGAFQNENFVHLLENFARGSQPSNPITGQLWYDTNQGKLTVYNGAGFSPLANLSVSNIEPSSASITNGYMWFDPNTNQLRIFNGSSFTLVGPEDSVGPGDTQLRPRLVKEAGSVTEHIIIEAVISDAVVFVISDESFVPDNTYPFRTDFAAIKQGITLSNTSVNGASSLTGPILWGTASNALNVVGETTLRVPRVGAGSTSSDSGKLQYDTVQNKFQVNINGVWSDLVSQGGLGTMYLKKYRDLSGLKDTDLQDSTSYNGTANRDISIKTLNAAPYWGIMTDYNIDINENPDRSALGFGLAGGDPDLPYLVCIMKGQNILGIDSTGLIQLFNISGTGGYLALDSSTSGLVRVDPVGYSNMVPDGNLLTMTTALSSRLGWDSTANSANFNLIDEFIDLDDRDAVRYINRTNPALRVATVVNSNTSQSGQTIEIRSKYFQVVGGQRYQFSAYFGIDKCSARVSVKFYSATAGEPVYISQSSIKQYTGNKTGAALRLSDFGRVGDFVTAPSNAEYAKLVFEIGIVTGSTGTGYVRIARPYVSRAENYQELLSPWTPSQQLKTHITDRDAVSGYERRFNQLSHAWGEVDSSSTSGTVVFADEIVSPVPTNAYGVFFTHQPGAGQLRYIVLDTKSVNQFTWKSYDLVGNPAAPGKFQWMAIYPG